MGRASPERQWQSPSLEAGTAVRRERRIPIGSRKARLARTSVLHVGDRGRWADGSKPGNWRDVFELFEEARARRSRNAPPVDHGPTIEDRALATMDLESTATLATVKTRYKQLVKRYHPDANGGDQSAEERLKSVIEAYSVLKNALQP